MKVTREQAEAIVRLLAVPEFRIFMDMLGDEGEKAMQMYIAAPQGLKSKQGRCQVYTEIIDAVATAKRAHEDYQNSK